LALDCYRRLHSKAVRRTRAEGKHIIFAWLLVQKKILTIDRLVERSWPCDPICPLCDHEQETVEHLCLACVFSQEVWVLVARWTDGLIHIPSVTAIMEEWWNSSMTRHSKEVGRLIASLLIYTSWNIWKERDRRIFDRVFSRPTQILTLTEEMSLRVVACGDG
jgi:hypothetical protein